MPKFRKKPVVIEAVQLTRKYFSNALNFIPINKIGKYNSGEFVEDYCYIEFGTLEGKMTASEGDWIIKGVKGEYYPCKPDIFEATYEPVTK